MTKDNKLFYKAAIALIIPMALQNLINVGVTAADVAIMGRVGEKALSGVSLGGQIQYVMTLIFYGLTSGASVLSAQYWGKRDVATISKIMGIAINFSLFVSAVFLLGAEFIPETLMRIYTNDREVINEGIKYLRIVAISYPFIAVTSSYLNVMRSVEQVKIATYVYLASMLTNVILNIILIFGYLGFPAMGTVGAAIATVIARIVETIIIVFYDRFKNPILKFKLSFLKMNDKLLIKDFMYYSSPVIINELLWGIATSLNSAVLGHLGSAVTAANSVAQVTRQLATVTSFGIANATAIMLGKAIGAGETEKAEQYSKKFLGMTLVFGVIGAGVVLIVRPIAMSVMNLSPESIKYLSMMMFVMSYFVIAQAYNTTVVVGICRSGGDTRFGLYLEIVCLWGGSLLFGFLAAYVFKLPVTAVYMILMCDEIIKIPITTWRYKTKIWLHNVTR